MMPIDYQTDPFWTPPEQVAGERFLLLEFHLLGVRADSDGMLYRVETPEDGPSSSLVGKIDASNWQELFESLEDHERELRANRSHFETQGHAGGQGLSLRMLTDRANGAVFLRLVSPGGMEPGLGHSANPEESLCGFLELGMGAHGLRQRPQKLVVPDVVRQEHPEIEPWCRRHDLPVVAPDSYFDAGCNEVHVWNILIREACDPASRHRTKFTSLRDLDRFIRRYSQVFSVRDMHGRRFDSFVL